MFVKNVVAMLPLPGIDAKKPCVVLYAPRTAAEPISAVARPATTFPPIPPSARPTRRVLASCASCGRSTFPKCVLARAVANVRGELDSCSCAARAARTWGRSALARDGTVPDERTRHGAEDVRRDFETPPFGARP